MKLSGEMTVFSSEAGQVSTVNQLSDFAEEFRGYVDAAKSASTRRAYAVQWRAFEAFCNEHCISPLPAAPEAVALYIGALGRAGKSISTLNQVLAAIHFEHQRAGLPSPAHNEQVKEGMRGARNTHGTAARQKAAITLDVLRLLVDGVDLKTVRGLRDRAILLVGFAGAFRRSELAALTFEDLQRTQCADGRRAYIVRVKRSKTDQEGRGMEKVLFTAGVKNEALCPVRALEAYIKAARIKSGPLFRQVRKGDHITADGMTGHAVANVVKAAGVDSSMVLDLGGHSLRRGFVTEAVNAGASERSIMNQTGHKSAAVMRRYIERHNVLTDNAAAMVL